MSTPATQPVITPSTSHTQKPTVKVGTRKSALALNQADYVVTALRRLHPEVAVLKELSAEARLVVSEPLGDLPGAWNEMPESTAGWIRPGTDELVPFTPIPG